MDVSISHDPFLADDDPSLADDDHETRLASVRALLNAKAKPKPKSTRKRTR